MAGATDYETFVGRLFRPKTLSSLKEPSFQFIINDKPLSRELYPFNTINDLLTQIYIDAALKEEYHPENLCLLREDTVTKEFIHMLYRIGNDLTLLDPLVRAARGPDSRFTTSQGDPTDVRFVPQGQILLENAFNPGEVTLRLFVYRDILAAYLGQRPLSSEAWHGCIRPYFPTRDREFEDGQLPRATIAFVPRLTGCFKQRLAALDRMEEILESGEPLRKPGEPVRGDPVKFSSVKHVRLNWDSAPTTSRSSSYVAFNIESFFYDLEVSPEIPYVRFFSKNAAALSKVHVKEIIPQPTVEPPELLVAWAKDRSLRVRPDEDQLVAKVKVGLFYATWFVYEDGSSQFIIQPPEGMRSLTRQDVEGLTQTLQFIETASPKLASKKGEAPLSLFSANRIHLQDSHMILSLWLEKGEENPLTRTSFRELLPFFKPLFQDTTSPIKEQNPLIYLRYKAVNNFVTPGRSNSFLRRIKELRRLQGAGSFEELVKYYIEEFDVPEGMARERVLAFERAQAETSEVQKQTPLIREFAPTENPGLDVSAFGKFPYYTFHLYRLDSIQSLRRIFTALSLFLTTTPESFNGIRVNCLEEEEAGAEAEAEQEPEPEKEQEQEPEAEAAGGLDDLALGLDDDFLEPAPSIKQLVKADEEVRVLPLKKEDEFIDLVDLKKEPARAYFLERLQLHDKRLFTYTKSHPSLKTYASMCAANALKQPAVMSDMDYEKMKNIYEDDENDGRVFWLEYPIKHGEPTPVGTGAETITTLRYGTSLLEGQSNVYICSRYWCRKDALVILTADFQGTKNRDGKPKAKNTCPFCLGGLVVNRIQTLPGETVIERTVKDKSDDKRHTFVRFLKSSPHPEGFSLPCCFIKDQPIFTTNPAFTTHPESESAGEVEASAQGPSIANYRDTMVKHLHKEAYILASNKLPLEVEGKHPQMGLVPPLVDRYFGQTKEDIVEKHGTMMNLKKDGKGFLRIGVENRTRFQADSFLAAIAPYYGYNTAQDIKQQLTTLITPNIFVALSYGNFLFDFYDPNDPAPNNTVLIGFLAKQFVSDRGSLIQKEALVRVYKAYTHFIQDMESSKEFKEYRQFAHFLSLPKQLLWKDSDGETLHSKGVVFIVLEVSADKLQVRCPPYGVTPAQARESDIAFILHYDSGIWEPLFYTQNTIASSKFTESHQITMVFSRSAYAAWPPGVKKCVAEFESLCQRDGLGIYTEVPGVKSQSLLPLSKALRIAPNQLTSIIRDTFNHVTAVTYKLPSEKQVIVPVVDDGTIAPALTCILDWRNLRNKVATEEETEAFYKEFVDPAVRGLDTYERVGRIRLDKSGAMKDFTTGLLRLKGKLFVPVLMVKGEAKEGEILESEQPVDFLPWFDDMKLMFDEQPQAQAQAQISARDFEEVYQHLRVSFATWFSVTASPTLREEVNVILFDNGRPRTNLTVMEKRQRLFIKLGNEILSWMDSSLPLRSRQQDLTRVNCIVQSKEACSGACVWKEETGRCLLHTPALSPIEGTKVDAQRLMVRKLLEELIRFPMKREELLKRGVTTRIPLTAPFRKEDQYLVRETMPAWSEFLRMDWAHADHEVPKYPEEILAAAKPAAKARAIPEDSIPSLIKDFIGAASGFIYHPLASVKEVMDSLPDEAFETVLLADGSFTSLEAMKELVRLIRYSLVQIRLEPDAEPEIWIQRASIKGAKKALPFYIFIKTGGGLGLLSRSESLEAVEYRDLMPDLQAAVRKEPLLII